MARRYLTVSIPYVNAAPHLGYALELVQADALARAYRQRGDEVRFLGGTDDHALKNALAAEEAGADTQSFVDTNADRFERLQAPLGVRFDDFIRTSTDPRHRPTVDRLWQLTAENDDFYRREYEGQYCVGCEQFYNDADLIDGSCPEHDTPTEFVKEENWFFRLSRYEAEIEDLVASRRLRIEPQVYANEVLSFVRGGLEDISVSRSHERAHGWGIPVPEDPTQVIYVWWDALANYISALGFAEGHSDYQRWWIEADERIHVIGKGIVRFHAIYWPALLLSTGQPLPTSLFVHPYLTANGQKLSKTTGNIVDPLDVVDRYGTDRARWWLLADVPRTADADYSHARLERRTDDDLANGVSNTVHRVLTMVHRFGGGRVPVATGTTDDARQAFDSFDFRTATRSILEIVAAANEEIECTEPWKLAKRQTNGDTAAGAALDEALRRLVTRLHELAALLEPLLPGAAGALRDLLTPGPDGCLPEPRPLFMRSNTEARSG